jgi:hypothetical protein
MLQKETLLESLKKINELLELSKTDSTIDVEDLKQEKRNCARELKKIRKNINCMQQIYIGFV